MKGHIKEGESTCFKEKFLSGEKIHTIRDSECWEKRIREVQEGKAVLSVRQWSEKPYRSKQIVLKDLTDKDRISTQRVFVYPNEYGELSFVIKSIGYKTNAFPSERILSKNDGLSKMNFRFWFADFFKKDRYMKEFIIIHFTDFRY
jgi:hypothetical protein